MLDDVSRCNLYYDHYKDSNEHIIQHIKRRNRNTIYLLVLLVFSILMMVDSHGTEIAASNLLDSKFGIDHISIYVLRTAELCCLFYISLNYFQCCLHIERSYKYIHNVELTLSEITGINIDRESTNYLANYPKLSDCAHRFYTYGIPMLIFIVATINIIVVISSFSWFFLLDLLLLGFLIFATTLYVADRHKLQTGKGIVVNFRQTIKQLMKSMFPEKQTFSKAFWLNSFLYLMVCLLICALPFLLTGKKLSAFYSTGQIGDTIGGCISPFIAMVAAYLTFIAFWVQYKANERQRNDISKERFNENFYNLLNIHEQITNSLEFEYKDVNGIQAIKGRNAFRFAFEQVIERFDARTTYQGMKGLLSEKGLDGYENSLSPTYFDHYFRCMYRIIKYVDDALIPSVKSEEQEFRIRYEYISILRSKLSRYELVWLFYNGLSTNGKEKFKPLIERYALLKNIRTELLVQENDKSAYADGAFGLIP